MDADPAQRNIFGLIAAASASWPAAASALRQFGQEIIELLGGKRIHPAWAVPGRRRRAADRRGPRPRSWPRSPRRWRSPQRALAWFKAAARPLPGRGADLRQLPLAVPGAGRPGRRAGALRRPAPRRRRRRARSSPTASTRARYGTTSARRSSRESYLKSPYYRAARLPGRHLPRRPAGAAERLPSSIGHAAGRRGAGPNSASSGQGPVASARSTTTTPG